MSVDIKKVLHYYVVVGFLAARFLRTLAVYCKHNMLFDYKDHNSLVVIKLCFHYNLRRSPSRRQMLEYSRFCQNQHLWSIIYKYWLIDTKKRCSYCVLLFNIYFRLFAATLKTSYLIYIFCATLLIAFYSKQ